MKITIRRKGKTVSMKCERISVSKFSEDEPCYYGASKRLVPAVFGESAYEIAWFGMLKKECKYTFEIEEEAINSFRITKNAALDYKKYCKAKK